MAPTPSSEAQGPNGPFSDADEAVAPVTPHSTSDASEAAEDPDILEDNEIVEEDEGDGEDLLGDAMEEDYKAIPELDVYDDVDMDNQEYDDMDVDTRLRVEAKLARRDREKAKREGRLPAALMEDDDDEEESRRKRRRRERQQQRAEAAADGTLEPQDEDDEYYSLEDYKGPVRQWLALERTQREVKRRFRKFLTDFQDAQGRVVYAEKIKSMCADNRQSLEISYTHLTQKVPILAIWVADAPAELLKLFDEVAWRVVLEAFENYDQVHNEVHVRINDLPISDSLRELRQVHLNALIKVSGVVTRRTGVFPQLKMVRFDCTKCGSSIGPLFQSTQQELRPGSCPECQSKGPFSINMEHTVYRNYQKITLQETPGSVPPGRVPRHKEVILLADLIDCARPGDEVEITGIYTNRFDASLNVKHGFPVFSTVIEANYVRRKGDMELTELTDEEKREIREMAQDPRIAERVIESIAPSIYGETHIKTALAMAMFGGESKDVNGKHRIRGDINCLLLGDPGVAKSQFLKYVEKTFHRTVYTTGKGASAVGLTAAVHKDPITREWTLEGGALVLADKGICLIDEFDKMNDQDRTSIHEAMEQQSISISKAGIVTTLQARCSVIAAANPVKGRYDAQMTFQENVDLTDPILSRFDILCVVRDEVDPTRDEQLAAFVVNSHMRSHPEHKAEDDAGLLAAGIRAEKKDLIPQQLLKKYILYARQYVRPKLADVDENKIAKFYAELRRESMGSGGVPMAVRHIESLIRMSEAHARIHLRDHVRDDDVDAAITVMLESFIQSQKYSVGRALRRKFQGYITKKKDHNELLFYLLQRMVRERSQYLQMVRSLEDVPPEVEIDKEDFETEARNMDIHDVSVFYEAELFRKTFTINSEKKVIVKHF
eukprot:GILK01001118.1.p1 GENE.GILK01001118.1~~GILK01001118.1.p1  ORF type:complete len:891 (+),score=144.69 GILK01001118.1:49-2721(+)